MLKICIYIGINAHVTPAHGQTDRRTHGNVKVEQYSAEAESAMNSACDSHRRKLYVYSIRRLSVQFDPIRFWKWFWEDLSEMFEIWEILHWEKVGAFSLKLPRRNYFFFDQQHRRAQLDLGFWLCFLISAFSNLVIQHIYRNLPGLLLSNLSQQKTAQAAKTPFDKVSSCPVSFESLSKLTHSLRRCVCAPYRKNKVEKISFLKVAHKWRV